MRFPSVGGRSHAVVADERLQRRRCEVDRCVRPASCGVPPRGVSGRSSPDCTSWSAAGSGSASGSRPGGRLPRRASIGSCTSGSGSISSGGMLGGRGATIAEDRAGDREAHAAPGAETGRGPRHRKQFRGAHREPGAAGDDAAGGLPLEPATTRRTTLVEARAGLENLPQLAERLRSEGCRRSFFVGLRIHTELPVELPPGQPPALLGHHADDAGQVAVRQLRLSGPGEGRFGCYQMTTWCPEGRRAQGQRGPLGSESMEHHVRRAVSGQPRRERLRDEAVRSAQLGLAPLQHQGGSVPLDERRRRRPVDRRPFSGCRRNERLRRLRHGRGVQLGHSCQLERRRSRGDLPDSDEAHGGGDGAGHLGADTKRPRLRSDLLHRNTLNAMMSVSGRFPGTP